MTNVPICDAINRTVAYTYSSTLALPSWSRLEGGEAENFEFHFFLPGPRRIAKLKALRLVGVIGPG